MITDTQREQFSRFITRLEKSHPQLDRGGFGLSYRLQGGYFGAPYARDDFDVTDAEAFWHSVDYLSRFTVTRTYPRTSRTSYGLKHDVERFVRRQNQSCYVANGVVIAALIFLGIAFRGDDTRDLSRDINVIPRANIPRKLRDSLLAS